MSAEDLDRLARLFRRDAPPAVLAGAGISLDGPSNLLDGRSFMIETLTRIVPPDVDPRWALSILDLPRERLRRKGEFLRFEMLMGSLMQSGVDPELYVLDCLDQCEHPNANHYRLAQLIRIGVVVLTTNFDRLIEIAYGQITGPNDPPLRVVYEDEDFDPEGRRPGGPPALWKLHGSVSVAGEPTRRSLQATLTSVMAQGMTAKKRSFLEHVLAGTDLLLVGYSGSDDFDILPVVCETRSQRRLLWVDHRPEDDHVLIRDARQFMDGRPEANSDDMVGRDRAFYLNEENPESWRRPPEARLLIAANTGRVLRLLHDTFLPGAATPAASGEYVFRQDPRAVTDYFDRWAGRFPPQPTRRYEFLSQVFSNRGFRTEDGKQLERIRRRLRRLQARRSAPPEDRLDWLIDVFNKRSALGRHCPPGLGRLEREVESLLPRLAVSKRGTALRLLACITWQAKGPDAGARMFAEAVRADRECDNPVAEIHTLTTWQQHTGAGGVRDHLSFQEHRRTNEFSVMMGLPTFPDDAHQRLREVSERHGLQPMTWTTLIRSFAEGYVEEDPDRVGEIFDEALRMIRFTVNTGDVRGEALSRFLMGQILAADDHRDLATMYFVYVLELARIVDLGEYLWRTRAYLDQMGANEYVEEIRPVLRRSIWDGRDTDSDAVAR